MRAKGFYGHIQNNHFRSIAMFAGFLVAAEIIIAVLLVVPIILKGKTNFIFVEPINYFAAHGLWTGLVAFAAWALIFLTQSASVRSSLGYRDVTQISHPRLHGIISPLAITAGVPEPKLAIIPSDAMNAMTHGLTKNSSTIVVTQGLLDGLDDDELAAVMAHEIAHIKRGDVHFMAHAHAAMTLLSAFERLNIFKTTGKRSIIFIIFAPILLIMAMFFVAAISVAKTIGLIVRLLISASRDYIADADAVQLTHNPGALISALRKIEGHDVIPHLSYALDAMMFSGVSEGQDAVHATAEERSAYLRKFGAAMLANPLPRKDTRAASLAAHGGFAFGSVASARQSFGRTYVEPEFVPPPRRKNLIDRVNAGAGTSAIGLKKGQAQIVFVFLAAIIMTKFMVPNAAMKHLEANLVDVSTPVPVLTPKSPRSDAVYQAIKAYIDDPEADVTIIVAEPHVTRLPERGIPVPSLKPKTRRIANPRPRPNVETVAGLRR